MEMMPKLTQDDLSDSQAVHHKINEYQKNGSTAALGYVAKKLLEQRDTIMADLERIKQEAYDKGYQDGQQDVHESNPGPEVL